MKEELAELKPAVPQSRYSRPSTPRSATPTAGIEGVNARQSPVSSSRVPSPMISASGSSATGGRAGQPKMTQVQEMAQNINKTQKMPEQKAPWRPWRSK